MTAWPRPCPALLHDQARNDPEGHDRHRRAFARLSRALRAENIQWEEPDTFPGVDASGRAVGAAACC
ncbi:hypothetical protein ACFYW1_04340 [Streptomyces sp. NPDC002669]|uniref:hypothetical protein n=1 Tax=Streptomyces sp. NPDC002669 TaxID=3364658 RepID=UPI0036B77D37